MTSDIGSNRSNGTPIEPSRLEQCLDAILGAGPSSYERILFDFFPDNSDLNHAKLRALVRSMTEGFDFIADLDPDDHGSAKLNANTLTVTVDSPAGGSSNSLHSSDSTLLGTDPRYFSHFEIVSRLGQGGMGVVYHALDSKLQREVALKLIHPLKRENPESKRRFLNEARAVAALDHPAVVRIYEVGVFDDTPFYAMQLVDADDLSKCIRESSRAVPDRGEVLSRTRIVERVARAVEHAHHCGFLHRDIKPSNILIRRSDQFAMLTDFGLVKRLDDTSDLTMSGAVVGTPNFAAPEQLVGSSRADHRADIYGLGATLYAALTGTIPFGSSSFPEVLYRVQNESLPLLRSVNRNVSEDLETICHKALEKDPADRFNTAEEFADELNREINGLPIRSRRTSAFGKAYRWARRNRIRTAAIALTTSFIVLSTFLYLTRPANLVLQITPAIATVTLDQQPLSLIDGMATSSGDPGDRVLRIEADGYEPFQETVALRRGTSSTVTSNVQLVRLMGRLEVDSIPLGAEVVIRSPTGERIAKGRTPFRSPELPSGDAILSIEKPLFNKVSQEIRIPKAGKSATIATVKLESRFPPELGSPIMAERLAELSQPFADPIRFDGISLDELTTRISTLSGLPVTINQSALKAIRVNPKTLKLTFVAISLADLFESLQPHGLTMVAQTSSEGTNWLVTSVENSERTLFRAIYSLESLRVQSTPTQLCQLLMNNVSPHLWEHLGGPCAATQIPSHQAIVVSADMDTHRQIANYLTGLSNLFDRNVRSDNLLSDAWSDGIAVGDYSKIEEAFPLEIDTDARELQGHQNHILTLLFLDDSRLLSGSADATIRLWDVATAKQVRQFTPSKLRVNCLVTVPGSPDQFIAGDGRGNLTRYDAKDEKSISQQHRHNGDVTCMAFTGDGQTLVSTGSDGFVIRYQMPNLEYDIHGYMYDTSTDLVCYNDETLIINSVGREQVWSVDAAKMQVTRPIATRDPIGRLLVVTDAGQRTPILLVGGTRLASYRGANNGLTAEPFPSSVRAMVAFPNHQSFATYHRDGRVVFRDIVTLKPTALLRLPEISGHNAIAVSPDKTKLAVSCWSPSGSQVEPMIFLYDLLWQ
ncbi:protein kinase domain-containing protein [Rubripirellula reticaptiva]|uniref:Serine/threonine-protein kinase PknF n=1 Tax=Rubripirellula reticaptiva TaxID=2528013 RepID=A0A5C6EJG4_9BACT|nr:protein kinase [Rubripirellula reticaptiva]TWU49172.1 Serine/threonine-protein kinase PknF [Rubripirellula reticaptiva]